MKEKAASRLGPLTLAVRRFLLLAAIVFGFAAPCVASTIELPDAGVLVNYDFVAEEPMFFVTTESNEDMLKARAVFLGDKSLNVTYDPEYGSIDNDLMMLSVYLTFTGVDVRHALDASFTHSLSLLAADGAVLRSAVNKSYGGYDGNFNYITYGWDFHFATPEFTFSGLQWDIMHDMSDSPLPSLLDAKVSFSGSAPILVVPEPCSLGLSAALAIACLLDTRR